MRRIGAGIAALAAVCTVPAAAQLRIAIVGDSVASGEGNPDASFSACHPGSRGNCGPARWDGRAGRASAEDGKCHRGTASGLLRAAEQLVAEMGGGVVETFACSGATTETLGSLSQTFDPPPPIQGLPPLPPPPRAPAPLAPQLQTLAESAMFRDSAGGPETGDRIDALILSVGANDIGFAETVTNCTAPGRGECYWDRDADAEIGKLTERYAALAEQIRRKLGERVGNVFIVGYFNPSVGDGGDYCGGYLRDGSVKLPNSDFFGISWNEARFAAEILVPKLNAAIEDAARRHGWTFVAGAADRFRGHGYCAGDAWVRTITESLSLQGSPNGAMHPNRKGHDTLRQLVHAAIAPLAEALTAPLSVSVTGGGGVPTRVAAVGGAGPVRQVAFFDLAGARLSDVVPLPPGRAGDGARQRVAGGRLLHPGGQGPGWRLSSVSPGTILGGAGPGHFAVAARSCNALICSAWSPLSVAPPVAPSGAALAKGVDGSIYPVWVGNRRNGAYQVLEPRTGGSWKLSQLAAPRHDGTVSGRDAAVVDWAPVVAPQPLSGVGVRPERAQSRPASGPDVAEFFVRGCNQGGCSEWVGIAGYVGSLPAPAPGALEVVVEERRSGGSGRTMAFDTGRRVSRWRAVPGTDVYQVLVYSVRGAVLRETVSPDVTLDASPLRAARESGFRVRACNVGGCSPWSSGVMTDGSDAPPPPAYAAVPRGASRAATGPMRRPPPGVPRSSI